MNTYILPNLTEAQKARAREILERESYPIAAEILAEPPPTGLGIRMSKATLSRLKRRLEIEADLEALDQTCSQAAAIASQSAPELQSASLVLLKEKAFQLALLKDPAALDLSCRILRNVHRIESKASPEVQKDTGPIEEFWLDLARVVLLRFDEIGSIRGNPALNQDRKIQLVRERLSANGAVKDAAP